MLRTIWFLLGLLSLGLGMLGAALPLLPTVPFILLAAFFFSRSSEAWHNWLINHGIFGPMISDWNEHRAISRRVKGIATGTIMGVWIFSLTVGVSPAILAVQAIVLCFVLLFIWTRAEGPPIG
ncbi:MAG: YbaN family protein [Rubricella sp.]